VTFRNNLRRSFDCLLWDIDGTLIDTTSLIVDALDHTFRTFLSRTLPPNDIRAIIGTPLVKQIYALGDPESFGVSPDAMMEEFIRYYEENRGRERIIDTAVAMLIAGKRSGTPTGLVTSKNLEEIANTLPRLEIAPYVDCIISADDVKHPKPDPEGLLKALTILSARPETTLYIGDTVHDMRAGKSAGVARCAVAWGAAPIELLQAESPEYLLSDPSELAFVIDLD
jgi:pyrophosphatase PpaX